jgi:hypothetical protein
MVEAQRALLDELMGVERNDDEVAKRERRPRKFYDDEVDKNFLCGLSTASLFENTRMSGRRGNNGKGGGFLPERHGGSFGALVESRVRAGGVRDEACKREFEALPLLVQQRYGFHHELFCVLGETVAHGDRIVHNAKRKVRERAASAAGGSSFFERSGVADLPPCVRHEAREPAVQDVLAFLGRATARDAQLAAARSLALAGDVTACAAVKAVECYDFGLLHFGRVCPKREHVCEVTGNMLSTLDSDDRVEAHFQGRLFAEWTAVRRVHRELLAMNGGRGPLPGIPGFRHDGSGQQPQQQQQQQQQQQLQLQLLQRDACGDGGGGQRRRWDHNRFHGGAGGGTDERFGRAPPDERGRRDQQHQGHHRDQQRGAADQQRSRGRERGGGGGADDRRDDGRSRRSRSRSREWRRRSRSRERRRSRSRSRDRHRRT